MVPKEVKVHIFNSYILKCKLRHNIAFMQWRYMNQKTPEDKKELEELILNRMGYFAQENGGFQCVSYGTLQATKLDKHFNKNYKAIFEQDIAPYLVSNWESIGWNDPFPNDKEYKFARQEFKMPKSVNDMVYPPHFFNPQYSPNCIYIPTRVMMFKIMRACVEVKDPGELWINTKAN